MRLFPRDPHPRVRLAAELVVVALGALALAWAWQADLRYCERHLLLRQYAFDDGEKDVARHWRIVGALVGLALLFVVRPLLGRWAGKRPAGQALGDVARFSLALGLSLVASEIALRATHIGQSAEHAQTTIEVRIGERDPRLGWVYTPSKRSLIQGVRLIEYDVNAERNRAARIDDEPDVNAPTILFVGESITAGHGLQWEETYPALVGKALGVQVVDLGVHGYGSDQAFLRFVDALPRFKHVVAVVSFYIPAMLGRLSCNDHPHLVFPIEGADPAVTTALDLRVVNVLKRVVPYRAEQDFDLLKQILRETDRRARERGAKMVFVYPQLNNESPRRDAWMVDELFHDQRLPVVDVDFGFEPIPGDNHPNEASTQRLADAVVQALRAEISSR